MTKPQVNYIWQKQSIASMCETVDCSVYDPIKDFHRDPSGFYVLIRLDFTQLTMEVAVCDKEHVIVAIFKGVRSRDIYHAIFEYEKKHGFLWFKEKSHIAYLGKELKKAELALTLGQNSYFQE